MKVITRLAEDARAQVSAKLGRCSRCMRASLAGAAGTSALAGGAAAASLPATLVVPLMLVAASFVLLVAAHALAYVVRPLPVGGPCCGQQQPRLFLRRPILQAILSLPSAFGLTQVFALSRATAQAELAPPPTQHKAVYSTELTCPGGAGGAPCTCTFTATFGYDYRQVSPTRKQLTHFTMQWGEASTGACAPSIERGSGAFDFQCVGDKQPCKLTGGNVFACPCGTTIQYVPLSGSQKDCICPNQDNKKDYAQGVCGAPVWIDKACEFEWLDLNFQHKVTCGCPDGHISRGFLTVVATFRDGAISFAGDYKPALSK